MTKTDTPKPNTLRKRIQNTADHPYWSSIITILGTIIAWVVIFFANPMVGNDASADNKSMRLLISTAFSIAVMLSLNWMWFRGLFDGQKDQIEELSLSFEREREKFFKAYGLEKRALEQMARRSKTFQIFIDRRDLSQVLLQKIAVAKNIRNTYIEISDRISDDVSTKGAVHKSYVEWIGNQSNGSWTDIVGIREFFSKRYTSIEKTESYTGEHYVFVLKHSVPIINFIVLDYQDNRPSEVFWGWISGDINQDSPIFCTSDPDAVNLFCTYFKTLKERTWNTYFHDESDRGFYIDYTKSADNRLQSASSRLVDKIGFWVTVSYTLDKSDGKMKANRLGVVEINYNEKGLIVAAKIYNKEGVLEEGETEHREFAHYLNSVFIGYRLEDSDFTGIC